LAAEKVKAVFTRVKKGFMRGFQARPGRTWAGKPLSTDGSFADSLRSRSERFVLAPLLEADAPALRALTDDPAITEAISFLESPFSLKAAVGLTRANFGAEDAFMGIRRLADNALVGVVGAHIRGEKTIEIGYWIGTAYQNQGYASEALAALLGTFQETQAGRQIFAECLPQNAASVRVLWKLGFVSTELEGSRPGRLVYALRERRGS
jgi:RimJ/RimL family protein N-acetyltransferase